MIGNKYTVAYRRPTKRSCAYCGVRLPTFHSRKKTGPPYFCLKCWNKKKTPVSKRMRNDDL